MPQSLNIRNGVVCGTSALVVAAPGSGLTAYGPLAVKKPKSRSAAEISEIRVVQAASWLSFRVAQISPITTAISLIDLLVVLRGLAIAVLGK